MSLQTPPPGQFPAPQPVVPQPQENAVAPQGVPAQAPVKRSYRKGLVAAAAASLVAGVAAVSVAGYMTFASGTAGAASPEELVASLDNAIESSDLVALVGLVSPADMANPVDVQDVVGDLLKVDKLVGEDALRAYGKHIKVHENSMDASVEKYSENLAKISFSSWKIDVEVKSELVNEVAERWRDARGDSITPMENLLLSQAKNQGRSQRQQVDIVDEATRAGTNVALMAVKEDGRWYISLSLSQDEATAQSSGITPNYQAKYLDIKSDAQKPEEAVQRFVEAVAQVSKPQDFAAENVIRYLPLSERRRVAIYGSAALEQANSAAATSGVGDLGGADSFIAALQKAQITWGLTSTQVDGGAVVSPGTTVIDFKGGPLDDSYRLEFDGAAMMASTNGRTDGFLELSDKVAHPERFGVFTIKEDGGWRISATGTVLNMFTLGANESVLANLGALLTDVDPSLAFALGDTNKLVEIGRGSPFVGTLIALYNASNEMGSLR